MRKACLFAVFLLPAFLSAQRPAGSLNPYRQIDERALRLPDSSSHDINRIAAYIDANFSTATEKTRAIFVWIANNIRYDVVNMFAINFTEDSVEKATRPLQSGMGICENYAWLFTSLCNKVGVPSLVIEGYTRERGFTGFIPHAWSAAIVDGAWYLFDPTWGSGFIVNGTFHRQLNEADFKAKPETFIASHMPFDYLWEFLYYPVTTEAFYEGKTGEDRSRPYFNYPDSIQAFEALPWVDREAAAADRIERSVPRNSGAFDMIRHLRTDVENRRRQAEVDRQNNLIDTYNSAQGKFAGAVRLYNVFVNYQNNQFKPLRPDAEIRQMLDTVDHELTAARSQAESIQPTPADTRLQQPLQQLTGDIKDLTAHLKQEEDWLGKYFSKSKQGRKSMFYKTTLFGVPIN